MVLLFFIQGLESFLHGWLWSLYFSSALRVFNHRLTTYSSASSVLPVANTKWLRRGSPWHRDTCWSWARVWRAAGTSLSIGGGGVYSTGGGVMTPLQRLVTECEGHKNRIEVKACCTCNGQRWIQSQTGNEPEMFQEALGRVTHLFHNDPYSSETRNQNKACHSIATIASTLWFCNKLLFLISVIPAGD